MCSFNCFKDNVPISILNFSIKFSFSRRSEIESEVICFSMDGHCPYDALSCQDKYYSEDILLESLLYILITALFLMLLSPNLKDVFRKKNNYKEFVEYILKGNFKGEIPHYRFFGEILFCLMSYRKKFGVDINRSCMELRKAALKDYKESKLINHELIGLSFQYIMIGAFTWFFFAQVNTALEIHPSKISIFAICGWQILGIIVGFLLFWVIKNKLFAALNSYFFTAYMMRALIVVSRPISEVIKLSKVDSLQETTQLRYLNERLLLLVRELKSKGAPNLEEYDNIVYELWDFYDEQLMKLKKFTGMLKLLLILLFVFPTFLYTIYLSLQSMAI